MARPLRVVSAAMRAWLWTLLAVFGCLGCNATTHSLDDDPAPPEEGRGDADAAVDGAAARELDAGVPDAARAEPDAGMPDAAEPAPDADAATQADAAAEPEPDAGPPPLPEPVGTQTCTGMYEQLELEYSATLYTDGTVLTECSVKEHNVTMRWSYRLDPEDDGNATWRCYLMGDPWIFETFTNGARASLGPLEVELACVGASLAP
jgi:hypothetical protein